MMLRVVLVLGGALLLTGCGGPTVKLTPTQGIVKLDGRPAGGIMVQFLPDVLQGSTGPTSTAITDSEGKFTLKTYDGKEGAVVGQHLVVLTDTEEERVPQGKVSRRAPRLAGRYSVMTPGQMAFEVKEGGAPIEIAASAK